VTDQTDSAPWWSWSRVRALDPRIVDPLVAALLMGIGFLNLAYGKVDANHPHEIDALAYVLSIVGFGVLAFRTRAPKTVLAVSMAATTWFTIIEYPENGLVLACLVGLYTVAALCPRRESLAAGGLVAAAILMLTALGSQGLDAPNAVANLAIFGTAYAVGAYVRVRRAYTAALEERAEDAGRTRQQEAKQAVTDERLRIARELHDVVAHAMSVVAVQSGVAAHVIDQEPDEAKAMLQTINGMSREALAEMRRLLGVLRSEGDAPGASLAPAPSLSDLDSLLASVTSTGVTLDVVADGEPRPLAPGLDLAAYRVVQEALTNVVRHAGPATVAVHITYGADALEIEIRDDGRGTAALASSPAGGHGLMGMRERVELYGGTVSAGPRPGGGFEVAATLPYQAESVTA
jgi:signal transduction histidine kinase